MKISVFISLTIILVAMVFMAMTSNISLTLLYVVGGIIFTMWFVLLVSISRNSTRTTLVKNESSFYKDVSILKGGINKNYSGMGARYDSRNPVTFLGINSKGIDGAVRLSRKHIVDVSIKKENEVQLTIKRWPKFLYGTEVVIQFLTHGQAERFAHEVKGQILHQL